MTNGPRYLSARTPSVPRAVPRTEAASRASRWAVVWLFVAALAAAGCSREGQERVPEGKPFPAPQAVGVASAPSGTPDGSGSPTAAPSAAATPLPDDAFYDPPEPLPQGAPGTVIRQRPYTPAEARLTQPSRTSLVMYLSTGTDGSPVAASGLVTVPDGPAPAGGRPVAAVNHGTMGIGSTCGTSRSPAFAGLEDTSPVAKLLARGFVVVQPDYIGLGVTGVRHPYLNGRSAAYATLDILRAARTVDPEVSATALVYGGSQGGHAALWTAHHAAEYAPELDLKGVAANAPAVGFELMPELIAQQSPLATPYVGMLLMLVNGASAADPAVKPAELLTPAALAAAEQIWTEPCISGGTPVPPATDVFRPGADLGPLNAALRASASNEVTTSVPVLLPQGGNDVLSSLNEGLARQLCEKGTSVEFKFYADQGHTIGGGPMDDAIAWLDARRAGEPVTGSCVF
ncbi:lipase family protein [Streptodolium elevatio]|uniref:Lipase family protein n=1 Tax=Streptodolium elevatio TaxID=3157996 RepID=A0ABV3DR51_9ACTN